MANIVSWTNPGTSGNWSSGANWTNPGNPSNPPGATDDVVLGDTSTTPYTVTLDVSSAALDSLTLGSTTGGVTLAVGSNTLNVLGSGAGNTDTITLQGTNGSEITIASGTIAATSIVIAAGSILNGFGGINAAVSGSGTVIASGGALELAQGLSTGGTFDITSGSLLQLDGSPGSTNTFNFVNNSGNTGELGLANDTGIGNNTISGMVVGTGTPSTGTDFVDIEGATPVTISSSTGEGTTSGTITLSDGQVLTLSNISSTTWTPNAVFGTAAGTPQGTEIFLTPCYCRGTRILTDCGEAAVEELAVGDKVITLSGKPKPITWIGRGRRLITPLTSAARPVIVRRDALEDGVPSRDLHLTGGHALYIDGVLIPVGVLVNNASILWDDSAREVEFYHLELAEHDVLLADGAPAESYRDDGNRGLFDNPDRPHGAAAEMPPFAPVLTSGPEVDRIWRHLVQRSGFVPPVTTDDPDLHLVVDGRRIDAVAVDERHNGFHGVYRFQLASAPQRLCIVSRSFIPLMLGQNPDPRRLGVAVCSIVLRDSSMRVEFALDSPWLRAGFNEPERDLGFRWTNGDATLPPACFALFEGSLEVALEVGSTGQYAVELEEPARERAAG